MSQGPSGKRGRGARRGLGGGRGCGCDRGTVPPVESRSVAPIRSGYRWAGTVELPLAHTSPLIGAGNVSPGSPETRPLALASGSPLRPSATAVSPTCVAVLERPDDCVGCGACEYQCPYGAVHLAREMHGCGRGLAVIDVALCTGCGRCVACCPQEALALRPLTGCESLEEHPSTSRPATKDAGDTSVQGAS